MSRKLGAQQETIAGDTFAGRNAEAIQKNFEKIFRRLAAFDAGTLTVPQTPAEGDLLYFDGTDWVSLPVGLEDEVLTVDSGLPAWADIPTQRDYWGLDAQNQWAMFGRATPLGAGVANPTVTGTSALNNQADSTYASQTTGTTIGDQAALIGVAGACQPRHDPILWVHIKTGASIANLRLFFGLSTVNFTNADDPAGAANFTAFRYSSATDAGWVGFQRDGAATTTSAQIAAIATDTVYSLKLRFLTGSGTYFSINGGAETLVAGNPPGGTSSLIPWFGVFNTVGGVGTARVWNFSRAFCRYGS